MSACFDIEREGYTTESFLALLVILAILSTTCCFQAPVSPSWGHGDPIYSKETMEAIRRTFDTTLTSLKYASLTTTPPYV